VNSREKDEHPSYSRANYVPAGGRNPTPPRKTIVLAGQARNKPLSIMATKMVLRRMKIEGATVHGFRSSFRDWAGNVSSFSREITETALAHVIGDKAEQAYRRAMIAEQSFEGRKENLNQANKLSRTHVTLLEALNRHRGKGHQKVTVEHVHVHNGRQAIVGNVEGGGVLTKSEN
jgi:hypothetical protein